MSRTNAERDQARAEVMRRHQYTTDNETLMAHCACGETQPVHDIGVHIERLAQLAADGLPSAPPDEE